MRYIFLSNIPPLVPLLDFNIGDINIDIHNDFECIFTVRKDNSIEFYFNRIMINDIYKETNAGLIFSDIIESNFNEFSKKKNPKYEGVLINFAKGELTANNKYFGDKCVKYFFIQFDGEEVVNIFCREAIAILW